MDKHEPAARKRYGQHFLHDPAVLARMVASVEPAPDDRLLEIGPGTGALTQTLLERVPRLHAVEIDRRLVAHLRSLYGTDRLVLLECDARDVDITALANHLGQRVRVVGNLPYNISTPLLFHCLGHAAAIQDLHVLLQREVVLRMIARPSTPEYGRLTVTVASCAKAESLFEIGPGAFRPPPEVRSRWVRLVPYRSEPFPGAWDQAFADVVAAAFQKRRKTLANALRPLLLKEEIQAVGLDPQLRAENLTPPDYGKLARAISFLRTHPEHKMRGSEPS